MGVHSRFGASSSHRWLRCPGSVKASADCPNLSTAFADEGTMLHEVAANVLSGLPHEYSLSDEQQSVVSTYVNFVKQIQQELNGELQVEKRFKLPQHEEFWGTSDAIVFNDKNLVVVDLKAGRGVSVEVSYGNTLNPQLGYYCLGAIAALGNKRDWDHIEIVVVQPRFGGIKRRLVSLQELDALARELLDAARKADSKEPPFEAGSHCKFCPARFKCSVLRDFVFEIARGDFDAVPAA